MLPQPGFGLDPGVHQVVAGAVLFCCPAQCYSAVPRSAILLSCAAVGVV